MSLFKREVVTVPGLRFNVGDTVWYMHKNEAASGEVTGRAWCEGLSLPDWWDEHHGATYFVNGRVLTDVYASKSELLASL